MIRRPLTETRDLYFTIGGYDYESNLVWDTENGCVVGGNIVYDRFPQDRYQIKKYRAAAKEEISNLNANFYKFGTVDFEAFIPGVCNTDRFVPFMSAVTSPTSRPRILSNGSYASKSFKFESVAIDWARPEVAERLGLSLEDIRSEKVLFPGILSELESNLCLDTLNEMARQSEEFGEVDTKTRGKGDDKITTRTVTSKYFVHNGGRFDLEFFLKYENFLNKNGWFMTTFRRKGKLYYIDFTKTQEIKSEEISKILAKRSRSAKKIENVEYKMSLRDSLLILPMGQAQLCKSFKVDTPKGSHPFEFITPVNLYQNVETWSIPDSSWTLGVPENLPATIKLDEFYKTYNISDTEGLYKCLAIFFRMLTANTGIDFSSCITAPSIAVKALKGITKNIEDVVKLNGPAKEFITQSYYGGRCEAAYPRMKSGTHYDINSMYAAAFCLPMPTGVPKYFLLEKSIPWEDETFQTLIDGKIGFIDVTVKLSIETIEQNPVLSAHPLLPLRTSERIISPTGEWKGVYTTAELKLAASLGYEITVHSGYVFKVDNTLFHQFISKFYNMRQAAKMNKNKALDQVSKLIMNSAYGRFALGTDPSLVTITCSLEELTLVQFYFNTVEIHKINSDEFQVEVYLGLDEQALESIENDNEYLETESRQFDQTRQDYRERINQAARDAKADDFKVERNIAIASIITSYARCLLYTYLIANPATVYMDTDSVMAARSLNDEDISSTKLGKMKIENKITIGAFAAPKLYSYENDEADTVFKGKGIDKKSQKGMGVSDIVG